MIIDALPDPSPEGGAQWLRRHHLRNKPCPKCGRDHRYHGVISLKLKRGEVERMVICLKEPIRS